MLACSGRRATPSVARAVQASPRFFATAVRFRWWLSRHAATRTELTVGFYKASSGKPSLSWAESVDEALCYGWIDGVRKRIDDSAYQIRFTLRKRGSIWSTVNIAKIRVLTTQGRMTNAGRAAYAHRTEQKSRVYAYEQAEESELSASEVAEFKLNRNAWKFLQSAPPSYRKVVLHWVVRAKKPATRISRLRK
jgi:uncharacterized protein YdeI (YjbR/CyaY-like superfamily)